MAQRKDMMRIIRQDAGFSEKLGFGVVTKAGDLTERTKPATPESVEAGAEPQSETVAITTIPDPSDAEGNTGEQRLETKEVTRKEEAGHRDQSTYPKKSNDVANCAANGSAVRGQVVYVAVSLTKRQAHLAENWAKAARCSVQFLIRRVAQGLRDQVFDDWESDGMPDVGETRGTRGKHPTSVTLTLRPQFAVDLTAKHDPLGVLGLARVMGPAFRARFQEAFDLALAKANIQSTSEGDEK